MSFFTKDPKSKADLIDRLLSQAFTGDLRDIATDPTKVTISRPKPHIISLVIDGAEFLLAAHKPKPEGARVAARKAYEARMKQLTGGRKVVPAKKAEVPVLPQGEQKGGTGRYAASPSRRKGR